MTSVDQEKVNALKSALTDKFENKQTNKKDDISGDFSTDTVSYPTVKAVKEHVSTVANGKVDKVAGKGLSTEDFTSAEKTKLAGVETGANKTTVDSALSDISENPVQNKVIKAAIEGISSDVDDLATVATSGDYGDLTNKPTLSSLGGVITLEKQATADSGDASTYVIKQGGVAISPKINIPKDKFLNSADVKSCTTANTPVTGLKVGDKYIDLEMETSSGTTHLYLNLHDLTDVYKGDNTTIVLGNDNTFSIKDGGVTLAKLATGVQTSLGYADAWNSSPAKNITNANITSWNNKSDLTMSDVDAEIGDWIDALTTALNS